MNLAYLTEQATGCRIRIYVQPNARRSAWAGVHGDALKLALDAPPVDGRANEALRRFLSEFTHRPLSCITIHRGQKSRVKTVQIDGIQCSAMTALLDQAGIGGGHPIAP